jgi:Amt family ammonium transporter
MEKMPSKFVSFLSVAVILFSLPDVALAQDTAKFSGADTAWVLTATALVLFMTLPALALFYAGLVRSRNVLSVLMHCFVICCVASVVWLAVGYSLAFSDGGAAN